MNSEKNLIIVTIKNDDKTIIISVDRNLRFCDLTNTLINKYGIDISQKYIKYNNNIIMNNNTQKIGELVNNDTRVEFVMENMKKLDKTKINNFTQVKIWNFIGQELVLRQLNLFYQNKKIKYNAKIIENDSHHIIVEFPSYHLAEEFIKFFNLNKSENASIKNIKYSFVKNFRTLSTSNLFSNDKYSINKRMYSKNRDNANNKSNLVTIDKEYEILNKKLSNFLINKDLNKYYSNQYYIRNASPYISEEEKHILDYFRNKQKWIDKRGFISSVGHYSMKYNMINNYVGKDPSENPLNHNFRIINKKKWITEKGFC